MNSLFSVPSLLILITPRFHQTNGPFVWFTLKTGRNAGLNDCYDRKDSFDGFASLPLICKSWLLKSKYSRFCKRHVDLLKTQPLFSLWSFVGVQ